MKPLIVLFTVFCLSLIATRIIYGQYQLVLAGRVSLSAMLIFSAAGHFAFTKGMSLMLPGFVPFRSAVVYLTGVLEIFFAVGLFFPAYRSVTALLLIVFLILVLPANVYASIKHLDYQKATFDGNGINYLWFRIPLQILFIVWTYFSAIKPEKTLDRPI